MKRVAIGVRMHSGWGALVAVSGDAHELEIVDRRQIVTSDPRIPGAKQPYHYAAKLGLPEAQHYLENCAAVSELLAEAGVGEVIRELHNRHFEVAGSVVPADFKPITASSSQDSRVTYADSYSRRGILS